MIRERIKTLQRGVDYSIMGAYLKGVAKDVAVLNKDTKLRALGESFCRFNNNNIDFTKVPLIDMDKFHTAPDAGGVLSNILIDINEKIKTFSEALILRGFDNKEVLDSTKKYAKKLQDAGVQIAYGEGAEDEDLKEDLRVLLKEGKNEFIKREQEEAEEVQEAAPDNMDGDAMMMEEEMPQDEFGDMPTEGMEPMEEGPELAEDEYQSDDYQAMADEQAGGSDEYQDEQAGGDDLGIPTGSFESYNFGEAFSKYNIHSLVNFHKPKTQLPVGALLSKGYKIKGLSKDEEKWWRERTAKFGDKNFFNKLWKAMTTENSDRYMNDGITKKLRKGITLDEDLAHISNRNTTSTIVLAVSLLLFGLAGPIFAFFADVYIGKDQKSVDFSKLSKDKKQKALAAVRLVVDIYDDLIKQAESRGDSAILDMLKKKRTYWLQDMDEMKRIIKGHGESFWFAEDLEEYFDKRNSVQQFAETRRFVYKDNIITSSPYSMKQMINSLLQAENASIKTIGESMNLSEASDRDSIYAANVLHKNVVNQTALILAARNKYGFEF